MPTILISGAGLTGLTASLLLANADFKVTLSDPKLLKKSESNSRVSALTPASLALFHALDINLAEISLLSGITLWEGNTQTKPMQLKASGAIVHHEILESNLLKKIISHKNIQIKLTDINTLDFTQIKLLIGADGANSAIREKYGINITKTLYPQSALTATIKTALPHQSIARQCFLSTGSLAFLPLADPHYCSIVWVNTPEYSTLLKDMPESEFNDLLQIAFGNILGQLTLTDTRHIYRLTKQHAKSYIKERIVLIGDAAHTIHPLAGQGLNLGLHDAHALSRTLIQARLENRDIGLLHTLRRYESARKFNNLWTQNLMDVFNTAYLRKPGFSLIQKFDSCKKILEYLFPYFNG